MKMDILEKRPHKCATNVANRGMSGRYLPNSEENFHFNYHYIEYFTIFAPI